MDVGALIDMERKSCESIIHDHDCDLWVTMVGGWMYSIVTGVNSDFALPSTYLVHILLHIPLMNIFKSVWPNVAIWHYRSWQQATTWASINEDYCYVTEDNFDIFEDTGIYPRCQWVKNIQASVRTEELINYDMWSLLSVWLNRYDIIFYNAYIHGITTKGKDVPFTLALIYHLYTFTGQKVFFLV